MLIGSVIVLLASGGGAGTGDALWIQAAICWSIEESPVDWTTLTPLIAPASLTLNRTVAVIASLRSERGLRRWICERTFDPHFAGEAEEEEKNPALLRDAAVLSDCCASALAVSRNSDACCGLGRWRSTFFFSSGSFFSTFFQRAAVAAE